MIQLRNMSREMQPLGERAYLFGYILCVASLRAVEHESGAALRFTRAHFRLAGELVRDVLEGSTGVEAAARDSIM
jgi:hypothetical protein